jgi:hypothetical protein
MALSVTATRLIRVASGSLWEKWLDLYRWPQWQPETMRAEWVQGQPWEVGSTFLLLRRGPFRWLHGIPGAAARRFTGKVLSTATESLLVWELSPTSGRWFGPVVVQSVRLAPAPGGTTVSLTLSAHGLGPALLTPLLGGPLHAQAEATLEALHRELSAAERRL